MTTIPRCAFSTATAGGKFMLENSRPVNPNDVGLIAKGVSSLIILGLKNHPERSLLSRLSSRPFVSRRHKNGAAMTIPVIPLRV